MFVSTDFLAIQYGVDERIAKFFVDREPPADNFYWKNKLLYLRFEPGYLFLPLIVDLLYKIGFSKQELLSEEFVQLMEAIGHISAQEEMKRISSTEALRQCAALAKVAGKNSVYLQELSSFFSGEADNIFTTYATGIKALHRGDLFLFAMAALSAEPAVYRNGVRLWFALISSLLLQDDAEDIQADIKNNDENAFVEMGIDDAGIEQIKELVKHNLQLLATVNKTMANKIDQQLINMFNKPHFQQFYKRN